MEGIPSNNTEIKKEENTVETKEGNVFRIAVDYSKSFEEMVVAGKYYQSFDNTAGHFGIVGKGIVEFDSCLFNFDRFISRKEALEEIGSADKDNPWTSAKIEHLLSFGATFPDEQHKHDVLGLGSLGWVGVGGDGSNHVPFLGMNYDETPKRILFTTDLRFEFSPSSRFLAVRPVRK